MWCVVAPVPMRARWPVQRFAGDARSWCSVSASAHTRPSCAPVRSQAVRAPAPLPSLCLCFVALHLQNLAKAGFPVVVYNRSVCKADALVDAARAVPGAARLTRADTPGAVAAVCDVVLSCLVNEAAAEEALLGPEGVLGALALASPGTRVLRAPRACLYLLCGVLSGQRACTVCVGVGVAPVSGSWLSVVEWVPIAAGVPPTWWLPATESVPCHEWGMEVGGGWYLEGGTLFTPLSSCGVPV